MTERHQANHHPARRWRALLVLALVAGLLWTAIPGAGATDTTPARPEGALMVPEHFLRAWDPVTIFFDHDAGPRTPGVETQPERFVNVTPGHPGVYRWLNPYTLQFRPVDPWPPLTDFRWQVGEHEHALTTLMAPAVDSHPADGASGLAPVDTLSLTFRDPLAPGALERMLTIRVHRQPAVDSEPLRILDRDDFTVQPLERAGPGDPASYRVRLHEPIAEGMLGSARLRLSLGDSAEQAFQTIDFHTRRPFRPVSLGCSGEQRAATTEGTAYAADDALTCPRNNRTLEVRFSEEPEPVDVVLGRNLVRFEPGVDNLQYRVADKRLRITGDFQADTLYRMIVTPAGLEDVHQRPLAMTGANSLHFAFPAAEDFLAVNRGDGRVMMERYGPQLLPLRGRGDRRVDLRIHPVDADNKRFWPFADSPVPVSDDARPPGPGEEPRARSRLRMDSSDLAARLHTLGSPSISEIIDLPLGDNGAAARFGLDLAPYLARIGGPSAPGTYLVGVRRLGEGDQRQWMRLQVTDLSLTVVEEEDRVRFVVTSLDSGDPVSGATVRVEASPRNATSDRLLYTRTEGRTDHQGSYVWRPQPSRQDQPPERIVVRNGDDTLTVDVRSSPPPRYFRNNFSQQGNWLQWTASPRAVRDRGEAPEYRCHLFTERPVYRPEEPVHIAGYLRRIHRGEIATADRDLSLLVHGPDGSEWRYRPEPGDDGGFHLTFDEPTEVTGDYRITVRQGDGNRMRDCDSVTVEKVAYRLPRFEVRAEGPGRTGMDTPFDVSLDAEYYAGGMVQERPVQWRVTQFPYHWQPRGRDGFVFSSDSRYGSEEPFESRPTLSREGRTDGHGTASITIDPTREPTAQPRRYVIEATVVGDDDQTVTDTADVLALPPFVVGLDAPRYLENADRLDVAAIMVGPDDELLPDREMTVRLIRRRWAARLQASDFTDGEPSYTTEVIDETLAEHQLVSAAEPVPLELPLAGTGVYLVELSARDALGRSQTVQLDLFNDGETRATWPDPPAETFRVTTTEPHYAPGDTARFVIQSPLATATALAIVERPDGSNDYQWVPVANGKATFDVAVERAFMPGVPVHFLLMRGRLEDAPANGRDVLDQGKPVMMAATEILDVTTDAHRVEVELDYPEQTRPGESATMDIRLSDRAGEPLSGHVTLWLVDQAVLSLGTEQALDPLGAFIRERAVRSRIRDTRNRPVGYLPFLTEPGGDEAARMAASADAILAGLTVRDTFKPVPYFEHAIAVDDSGHARVTIDMPDDLTNFMVRAKATAGGDRFGYQTGRMAVRLPVIVQPALPRFLRYGDELTLSATSRVLDGDGGSGVAALRADGVTLEGAAEQRFTWPDGESRRIDFPVRVPMPERWPDDPTQQPRATITLGVERRADGVGDAFAVDLPIHPDRDAVSRSELLRLEPGGSLTLDALDTPVRGNSLRRSLLLSGQAGTLEMAGGLNYLLHYPHGNTEHRLSRARGLLAARELFTLLYPDTGTDTIDRHVRTTLDYLDEVTREDGFVGFWPGARHGNVAVTAWSMQFLVEAEAAGFSVDAALRERIHGALRSGLRGGHDQYFSRYLERTLALEALANAGELDSGYAAELARRTQFLRTEARARVARALASEGDPGQALLEQLADTLWGDLVFRLQNGDEVYAGLRETHSALSPVILPSETRTIAQVLRAMRAMDGAPHREHTLVDILVQLGAGDGWGTTNANTEAILALADVLRRGAPDTPPASVTVTRDNRETRLRLDADTPLHREPLAAGAATLESVAQTAAVGVLHQQRYVPAAGGDQAEAQARGFVVERGLARIEDTTERTRPLEAPGQTIDLEVGTVVEDRLTVVNPEERHHVAVVMPLAAGMEPLNPTLETAPPEAAPSQPLSREPDYARYDDHEVAFYYQTLPAGTYHFAFRLRAQVPGRFTQPPAVAELMYRDSVRGQSHGTALSLRRDED